ncbi:beta-ketoacyl synthase N-terminal-like domain-containing protein [Kitasatospora sp. NPDC127111]|uniref:beta-ketoacyl synthase N-terminal-like domain-containing protein n=1 Tax=Kitasatospora sp. NPDC127111 TaxID=3345363 RepID=UPI003626C102
MTGLRILAEARWPDAGRAGQDRLPPVPGFAASTFNPLVAEVAERCLRAHHGTAPAPGRTALLLASAGGDRATARAIDEAAASGRRVPPLLFFQSNPNAVLGHIAARWGLTGPVVAISPAEARPGSVPQDALDHAALLLADGDADHVLVIAAEAADAADASDGAGAAGAAEQADTSGAADATGAGTDRAVAVLVTSA